jgi:hypothetical protein
MFGTENGRYDASEHAHDFLLTMSVIPTVGTPAFASPPTEERLRSFVEFCERGRDYAIKSVLLPRRRGVLITLKKRRFKSLDSKVISSHVIDHYLQNWSGHLTRIHSRVTDL